jgi:predicted DNA-binding transcriptional regulator AlpA
VSRPAAPLPDLAVALHQLADRLAGLDVAEALGELEVLRVRLWREVTTPVLAAPAPPTRAVSLREVVERSGMSRDWIYKQARANRLPFARRMGRRVTFDAARFAGWLERLRSR